MTINWNQLRAWNGDQRNSFEELCCQLAAVEKVTAGARFTRKGTPDAGVECYWKFPAGEEWCWQAKYFRQHLHSTQWKQLDSSFLTAFAAHPDLTKYIVCLPQNLPDGHVKNDKSARSQWETKKQSWIEHAANHGRTIEIDLWDETQLARRLSQREHQGTHWFWFDSEQRFTLQWFQDRLEESIENAGDRYTPQAHVDLPIAKVFSGLGRCPDFCQLIEELTARFHSEHRKLYSGKVGDRFIDEFELINNLSDTLSEHLHSLIDQCSKDVASILPFKEITRCTKSLNSSVRPLIDKFRGLANEVESQNPRENRDLYFRDPIAEQFRRSSYLLWDFANVLNDIDVFASSSAARLTNLPALLLEGGAGQGKTHLVCDIAKRDLESKRPRILLHGSHFQPGEPWQQAITLLGLNCTIEQFLGGLQACAQTYGCRVLIFIDAINEGAGPTLWKSHIPGILARLRRYRWLGLCMTVRSTYKDLFFDSDSQSEDFIRESHRGFGEQEEEAVERFFTLHKIVPTYPLMVPEFSNPLFLKLFCTAIKNQGLNHVPLGIRGISAIINLFLTSVNKKLSSPTLLDFNVGDQLVGRAVERLCKAMADRATEYLPRSVAEAIVNEERPIASYSKSLFAHLVHEGLLNVDRWTQDNRNHEVVHFSYQRFADHLMAMYLLNVSLDPHKQLPEIIADSALARIVNSSEPEWQYGGLLEALSVQLPERTGVELISLFPRIANTRIARDAFIASIVWRSSHAVGEEAEKYIRESVLADKTSRYAFWNAVLTVAPISDHPLNAEFLHSHLQQFTLPERDAWWSIFLHDSFTNRSNPYNGDTVGAIRRLIRWAWNGCSHDHLKNDVIQLVATALGWLLTSSNRFLRDTATKALVNLLAARPQCLSRLLRDFRDVDDPYVAERLYAVAYGCAMRCPDVLAVNTLAIEVYAQVFEQRKPPAHVRLRDYARGIIELSLTRDPSLPIDTSRIRPPYCSKWPRKALLPEDTLRRKISSKQPSDANRAISRLVQSVTSEMEDFCTYVIGDLQEWSNVRLGEHPPSTTKELVERFERSLTPRQRTAYDTFCDFYGFKGHADIFAELPGKTVTNAELAEWISEAEDELKRILGASSKKWRTFETNVRPYLDPQNEDLGDSVENDRRFDVHFARKWILQRVVELGWTADRFGDFDQRVNQYEYTGRSEHKPERIGKKYQWIAYCELQARIADNFEMKGELWSPGSDRFRGPWQINHGRDIDPSLLLSCVKRDTWRASTPCWWFSLRYAPWDTEADHLDWLQKQDSLPNPAMLLEVVDPDKHIRWLTLEADVAWEEPVPIKEERYERPRRKMRYVIRSYLVRSQDASGLLEWVSSQQQVTPLLDKGDGDYSLYLGEYFWSPAYADLDNAYNYRPGWTRGRHADMPCEILSTSEVYARESGTLDCSVEDNVFISLPCKEISTGMNLRWGGKAGEYVNDENLVVSFDPSVHERGPSSLLIRCQEFLEYLQAEQLEVFWCVTGEKERIGGPHSEGSYLGRLEIVGLYFLDKGQIKGKLNARFQPPRP